MIVLVDDDSTLSLRGGGGETNGSSVSSLQQQQQHLSPRPETVMSSHLRTHAPRSVANHSSRGNGADDERRAAEPKSKQPPQQVRPRKSSETLSSPILSQFPEPSRDGSATSLVHTQHSVSGGRRVPRPLAPLRPQGPQQQQQFQKHMSPTATTTTGLPANFFSLTALSRSSKNRLKSAGRGRGIGAFAAEGNHGRSEQAADTDTRECTSPSGEMHDAGAATAATVAVNDPDVARHWPLSPNGSRYVYIPPAIEEKSGRGSRLGDSLETASMQSLGSSYTVRIEE
ncbi:hypothetical protein PG993_004807 [Apiospora rasikravindrae]|uniref:Uncharacterized protein n=1 Tax=Apiospora rasikravindrae TaxID=990691 RepID=A0ABR1TDV7_9PEZI